jgi:glucose/arabinose dehydrogenase
MSDRTATALPLVLAALSAFALPAQAQEGFDLSSQYGPDPVLPEPQMSLLPEMKVAEVVGWQEGQAPEVPEGLTVTAYATDLANPRTVHTLPNGDVLVVQGKAPEGKPVFRPKDFIRGVIMSMASGGGGGAPKESNLITLLRDTDRDGTVDERSDLLTGLSSPFGVAWADGQLYVAAADAIVAYPYELGGTEITDEGRVLTPLPGGPINHHWTKDLALSPDGRMLYVSVGSNSNVAENGMEAEKGRAAIWEVDRETGASRVFASGLRNPNGLVFEPETEVLWAVINERDELGPNLVPDYMTSVVDGAFYGWPWSYYGDHVDPRVHPPRPDMVALAVKPDYALTSHVAPLGLAFTAGATMPEAYAQGAFVGQRGSWNRDHFNGYKVIYVPFEGGKPSGQPVDVVTGFLDGDTARGRPVGVGIDGTGALLVADDAGNTVWRVAAADGTISPEPVGTDVIRTEAVPEAAADPEGAAPGTQTDPAQSDATRSDTDATPVQPAETTPEPEASEPAPQPDAGTEPAQTQIAPATEPSPEPQAETQGN